MPPAPLRIGVDARAAAEVPAGRGRYVRELARALMALGEEMELVLYGRRPWPLPGTTWRLIGTPDPLWGAHAGLAAGRHCDAVLASNSYLMSVAHAPVIAVVQDLFGLDRSYGSPAGAIGERLTLPLAVRRAAGFACASRFTRDALEERFPLTRGRTRIVPLGVDSTFAKASPGGVARRYGIDGPYVLAVGTREPRKNLPRLVEAFGLLDSSARRDPHLVLAGARGWSSTELDELLGRNRERVHVLGFAPNEDLAGLYAEATAFAFPSLAEGFGLPVLEAMAAGTPVLTSDRSALPEVAGDAALLVDPTDTRAIAAGLERLLSDEELRTDLSTRGRRRAAAFTWERTARETFDYLRSATSTLAAGNRRERAVSS